jgi:hypothetical protein
MNIQLLIDGLVRQFTVLIAQLATSGGVRAPLTHLANQVFLDLANELQAQGVSRKVSADMFGMALRAYLRKVRRLSEGQTDRGKTLWQAVLDFIRSRDLVGRDEVLDRFRYDDPASTCAVLFDLTESGLVFMTGSSSRPIYRAAGGGELSRLAQLDAEPGFDELVWNVIYRQGPFSEADLVVQFPLDNEKLEQAVQRLEECGRIHRDPSGRLRATDFAVPLGATIGWEAAVFDHLQAVVQTICQRLRLTTPTARETDTIGGSTYSFDVWPGHPFEAEVRDQLRSLRARFGELRERVKEHNRMRARPNRFDQVTIYLGQSITEREGDEEEHDPG